MVTHSIQVLLDDEVVGAGLLYVIDTLCVVLELDAVNMSANRLTTLVVPALKTQYAECEDEDERVFGIFSHDKHDRANAAFNTTCRP
jgi:hypothetical protein